MKNLFLIALTTLITLGTAEAAKREWKGGSQCGLTDLYGEDSWRDIGQGYALGQATEKKVAALPTIIKQQLIISAKLALDEDGDNISNTMEAVHALRKNSEGDDLYVGHFEFEGNEFTTVVAYPGGTPVGYIFKKDTRHLVATISDSDVVCAR